MAARFQSWKTSFVLLTFMETYQEQAVFLDLR